ncbi:MAG: asparagine--tRNA ligase [Candidatus Aenigmarchaeota archaeon]|nr:asparagine--tRNA ligase [Candidatus Aenigmarchaeota archaeon]
MYISVKEAMEQEGKEVDLRGWCYRERKSNKFVFMVLRDHSDIIQCVVNKDKVDEKTWNEANKIMIEASLKLSGIVRKDERAPTGYEVDVKSLEISGQGGVFPITKDQSQEFLLDVRHLWLRSRKLTAVMKIRSTVFEAVDEFFRNRGFYEAAPPIFTPNACEGGATLFKVKYFDDTVYLTQSWQLYAEAMIASLEKIYCNSPCFRAEKSKTSRHLAEFYMAEMEMAWAGLDDVMRHAEELVSFIIRKVLEKNKQELEILKRAVSKLENIRAPFPRITYTEALKILDEKEGMKIKWGKDLRTIEEDLLMKHFNSPVMVTHYPKEIMAFYKPKDPNNPETALCFDMLAPEGYGEIIGGSQRETDIEELKKSLKKQGEKTENYEWYLDTRRHGSVPHAGFGMGVERMVAWLCGLDNIKDAIPFPRTMLRKSP